VIVAQALREAALALGSVSETPRLDAELLMADAFGVTRSALLLTCMNDLVPTGFTERIARRAAHEPIAYITGQQEFWSLDLAVSPAVLIPRADSETLIEAALDALRDHPPQRIIDLGTGSGALLLAALTEWPDATGVGIDASTAALEIACANATALGLAGRAQMKAVDWRTPGWASACDGPFDLLLANPPYVETAAQLAPQVKAHEPHAALFAGDEGLDDYRILLPVLGDLLSADGIAIFEIGAAQRSAVTALAQASGYTAECRCDLAGHDRALILRKPCVS